MILSSRNMLGLVALLGVSFVWAGCAGKKDPVAADKLDVSGKIRLAQAYVNNGRLPEALETLEQAVKEDPGNPGLRNFQGQVLFLAGRYEPAEQTFRKALELDPYMTDAHNNLGAVYDKMGRKDDAEREFLAALADPAYPTPEKVYLNLGLLYLSQGRQEMAIDHMRRAVEIDPKYYQAHFELASLLDQLGQIEEAASEYEVAGPAFRNSGDYHYRLGFVYFKLGDQQKAAQHLNRVLDISPGSRNAVKASELLKMIE